MYVLACSIQATVEVTMKTVQIQITTEEYDWLTNKAEQQKITVAQVIEGMVSEAYLYKAEELPPYDWGEEGIPEGQAVKYEPEFGLVIVEEGEK
jgi:hypothetical protein